MTTDADNSEDESEMRSEDISSDAGVEFSTISSFDKFATLANNIGPHGQDELTASQTQPSSTAGSQRLSGNSIVAGDGSYQLITEVARSPRAVIYKARQLASNRLVIFKLLLETGSSGANAEHFLSEMAAAMKLSHPGIVSIYDTGHYDGKPFICMEHVDGCSLSDHLKDGPLPPRQAAEIVQQIATAVSCAHGNGVVHRQLTPSNVLCDIRMVPHLIGFGQFSMRLIGESQSPASGVRGADGFLAPEQVRNPKATEDQSVDVYGVGAILYCLLTGRPPFLTSNQEDTLRQIVEDNAASPRLLNRLVPHELEAVCQKCLSKTPALRYSSVAEITADLERWLKGEPVQASYVSDTHSQPARIKPQFLNILRNTIIVLLAVVSLSLLVKLFQDSKAQHDLTLRLEEAYRAEKELEVATRMHAESHEEAKRSLKLAEEAGQNAYAARQAAEQAWQQADKARADLLETQKLMTKAKIDLEFLNTLTLVAKLEAKMESVRHLGLKGEFDEAFKQIDELVTVNVGQLPPSVREEKRKVLEALRDEMLQLKNKPQ